MAKPTTADHNLFWILAQAYHDAAEASIQRQRSPDYRGFIGHPIAFLQLRSLELSLKAVLLASGVKKEKVHHHKLLALLEECKRLGIAGQLGLSPEVSQLVTRFSELYSEKWYEYPEHLASPQPAPEEVQIIMRTVFRQTVAYLQMKDDERGRPKPPA